MISFFTEIYNRLFRPKRSKQFQYLMTKLVTSADEIVDLKTKLAVADEALRVLQEENTILWQQLDDIKEAETASVKQFSQAMEDAYWRALKTVGDA